jgi:hypothetical protein
MNVLRAREWMARQTIQLHQPLASPSWLLPLNKRQPSGLQQFANSIMKESNQPFPTVAKIGRLSELSCLNKRPFEKTLRTLLLHQVYILFPKQTSWIGMQRRLSPENGGCSVIFSCFYLQRVIANIYPLCLDQICLLAQDRIPLQPQTHATRSSWKHLVIQAV